MGKAKILRNIRGGFDEMLIIAYIVGGWVQKSQKSAYVIYGRSLIHFLCLLFPSKCFNVHVYLIVHILFIS